MNRVLKLFKKISIENLFSKISYKNVSTLSSKNFIGWWEDYKKINTLDIDLQLMLDDLINSEKFKNYSSYWNHLAQSHIKLINENGIENFKQTIEKSHYSGDGKAGEKILKPIWHDKIVIKYDEKDFFRKHDFCTQRESERHNKAIFLLINYLVVNGYEEYLKKINENKFGNPILFKYLDKEYSFPLLNSILEIDVLKKNINLNEYNSILEIGAGSGRICSALMQIKKNLYYTIVDIPPTLFVSQSNLSNIFKDKKIFKYRKFNNFKDVEKEFISSEIRFLLPEQLNLLPNKYFDISIAVDCLHELNKIQVNEYFHEFDRLSKFFYFKCQNNQWATFEIKEKYKMNNYPTKDNWNKIIHEKCYVPDGYFQALYKID